MMMSSDCNPFELPGYTLMDGCVLEIYVFCCKMCTNNKGKRKDSVDMEEAKKKKKVYKCNEIETFQKPSYLETRSNFVLNFLHVWPY